MVLHRHQENDDGDADVEYCIMACNKNSFLDIYSEKRSVYALMYMMRALYKMKMGTYR